MFHRDESRLQGQVSLFGGKGLPGVEVVVLDEWWSRRRKSSCTLNINSVNLEPVKMAVDVVLKFHKRVSGSEIPQAFFGRCELRTDAAIPLTRLLRRVRVAVRHSQKLAKLDANR
jgi:hypothetical protein